MFGFLKSILQTESIDIQPILEKGAIIIDVRSPQEFRNGHPKGAINIPLENVTSKFTEIKKYNKPVITCCVSGARSGMAAKQLNANGIEAYNGGPWGHVSKMVEN